MIALGLEPIWYIVSAKNFTHFQKSIEGLLLFEFNGLQYCFAAGQVFVAFANPVSVSFW